MAKKLTFDLFFLASRRDLDGSTVLEPTEVEVPDGEHVEGWEVLTHHGNLAVLLVTSTQLPAKTVGFQKGERWNAASG